ncbi:DUF1294 domain-containing protein [Novosphingobium sp. BL-52-GroH]|uniref:DUF1294 domain-containing protein n=1 Tax=Novosphingobium sp. BL-52-GroH TaxID=3349877 RepID=UPI00384F5171
MSFVAVACAALAMLNLATFVTFAIDKSRARTRRRRIAESTLLWLAAAGGSPGAYAARHAFRHKTRKQPFVGRLHMIAALQVVWLAASAYWLA